MALALTRCHGVNLLYVDYFLMWVSARWYYSILLKPAWAVIVICNRSVQVKGVRTWCVNSVRCPWFILSV